MMSKLSAAVFHAVHGNGVLADLVYGLGFHLQERWAKIRARRASSNRVEPEEVHKHRHLLPSSNLITGVTSVCNAKCVFCAYPKVVANKTLKTGVMSQAVFEKAVTEWLAAGGTSMDLTHTVGDALVDPGLLDKIAFAVKAGIKELSLTTNGILLDRNETYKKLVDSGMTAVYISAPGTDKAMYERIYGVNQYDAMISGVHHLLEYNRSKGEPLSVVIRFRNGEKPSAIIRSKDFREKIRPFFSRKMRINFTTGFDNWGGTIKPEETVGTMRMWSTPEPVNVPCVALFGYLIRHDGSVRMCGCRIKTTDMDDMVVGNLKEQTLEEISKSDRAWNVIRGFYDGKRPETCQGCTLYRPVDRAWWDQRVKAAEAAGKS